MLAVARPVPGIDLRLGAEIGDLLLGAGTFGILQKKLEAELAVRTEQDLPAIGTPDRRRMERRIEG